ncbi:hypothetical protein JOF53_003343 [Crossiella equi]|uniref:XRE family transcriptional regulator n=1 Tax=Crossiella equi TaxID=130796 RepID=A0ABS5ADP1_9PSEU|nr:hypothetical protein [Crossiella equi]MBP2474471.1 hypothetical protein [Crossiella equi]
MRLSPFPLPAPRIGEAEAAVPESFPAALTEAIERSGLSLDSIQRRLRQRGVRVSLSTLSYWRRGRSQPERRESLVAVGVLEEVLGLPRHTLLSLLGPRRPRGRWLSRSLPVRPLDTLWEEAAPLSGLLESLGAPTEDQVTYLSLHELHAVDEQGRDRASVIRAVVRAEVDGVDRCAVTYRGERTPPAISARRSCRLGRVRTCAGQLAVAELIMDRVLRAGETAVLEYEVVWPVGQSSAHRLHRFRRPVREYVAQVEFHRDAVPSRCFQTYRHGLRATEMGRRDLWIGAFRTAHMVALDVPAGIVGLRWEWN